MNNKARQVTLMSKEISDTFAEMTETNRLIALLEEHKKTVKKQLNKLYGRSKIKRYKQGQGVKRARSILISLLGEACSSPISTGREYTVENKMVPKEEHMVRAHMAHLFEVKEIK